MEDENELIGGFFFFFLLHQKSNATVHRLSHHLRPVGCIRPVVGGPSPACSPVLVLEAAAPY